MPRSKHSLKNIWSLIGPGLITAGAAVGVSHLIQSTRAGALYSFELLFFIFIANVLKFPILEQGVRVPFKSGKNLLEEYKELGVFPYYTFILITLLTSTIILSAISVVTAGVFKFIFSIELSIKALSAFLILAANILLLSGGYRLLDKIMKYLILALSVTVLLSCYVAFQKFNFSSSSFSFQNFSFQKGADIAFLLALIGWMPIPVEASVWQSIWYSEKKVNQASYIDFHVGYWLTMILAVLFLSLGAMTMFSAQSTFSASAVGFSKELISMLSSDFGSTMKWIISFACFSTMVSTLLTCLDAYARVFDKVSLKFNYRFSLILCSLFCFLFIYYFLSNMKSLVDFATIISFLVTPLIGWFNFQVFQKYKGSSTYDRVVSFLFVVSLFFFTFFSLFFLYQKL